MIKLLFLFFCRCVNHAPPQHSASHQTAAALAEKTAEKKKKRTLLVARVKNDQKSHTHKHKKVAVWGRLKIKKTFVSVLQHFYVLFSSRKTFFSRRKPKQKSEF
jgi:hypothetical protein